jgi:hypothetical protein
MMPMTTRSSTSVKPRRTTDGRRGARKVII